MDDVTTTAARLEERRGSPRMRALKAAAISFGGGRSVIDCVVRNLSNSGATLAVESPIGIPDLFDIHIPSDGLRKSCRVVWRKPERIGVVFV